MVITREHLGRTEHRQRRPQQDDDQEGPESGRHRRVRAGSQRRRTGDRQRVVKHQADDDAERDVSELGVLGQHQQPNRGDDDRRDHHLQPDPPGCHSQNRIPSTAPCSVYSARLAMKMLTRYARSIRGVARVGVNRYFPDVGAVDRRRRNQRQLADDDQPRAPMPPDCLMRTMATFSAPTAAAAQPWRRRRQPQRCHSGPAGGATSSPPGRHRSLPWSSPTPS